MKLDLEKTNEARKRHQEGVELLNRWFRFTDDGSTAPQRIRNKPTTHSKRMRARR